MYVIYFEEGSGGIGTLTSAGFAELAEDLAELEESGREVIKVVAVCSTETRSLPK